MDILAEPFKIALDYLENTRFEIGAVKLSLLNLIHGFIILILVFWLAAFLSRTLESYLRRRSTLNYSTRELIVKFFKLFVYFTALLITLDSMGVNLTAFAVFGGALGVGIGFGLQKISANFISGIILLMEKSVKLGDLIEVGGTVGWVRQLNIRYTLVETLDGRAILIPNDELLSTRVTSWTYTDNKARAEIPIGVSYDSDARLAQTLILEAASEHPASLKSPPPSCQLRTFGEAGIIFNLYFWISDIHDGRIGPQSEIMFSILEKFKKASIKISVKQT